MIAYRLCVIYSSQKHIHKPNQRPQSPLITYIGVRYIMIINTDIMIEIHTYIHTSTLYIIYKLSLFNSNTVNDLL
jgi:hypothetical protein